MNWNETMTVRTQEYHNLIQEKITLKERVTELEEEIKRLKSVTGSASGVADTSAS